MDPRHIGVVKNIALAVDREFTLWRRNLGLDN